MSATLINLIIQLVAGAVGGNAVGAGMKNVDLGTLGNTIAGAIGGAGGGTLLTVLLHCFRAVPVASMSGCWSGKPSAVVSLAQSSRPLLASLKTACPAKRRSERQDVPGRIAAADH
jgi:uncharacterized membrane protein YeaQ/YmgE (transglycosylase-associated protein family)